MTQLPMVVIGPYAAPAGVPSEEAAAWRAWNVARARLLVTMLHRTGIPAWCIHGEIDAGTYGDDSTPEDRALGLATSHALTAAFPRLTVLARDDGSMSSGTLGDLRAWAEAKLGPGVLPMVIPNTWAMLRDGMEAAGLLDRWEALATPPSRMAFA